MLQFCLFTTILLKCHIPLNSSHQNSSKSCLGLVLPGSPTCRTQCPQRRCKSWEQLGGCDFSGWQRLATQHCWGFTPSLQEKGMLMWRNAHPPIGQAEPYATGSPKEMGNSQLAGERKGRRQERKGKEASRLQGRTQSQRGKGSWFTGRNRRQSLDVNLNQSCSFKENSVSL